MAESSGAQTRLTHRAPVSTPVAAAASTSSVSWPSLRRTSFHG
ncbi:hypothetical protein [Phenylobacterium sp.]|nr:hypothetical protein [Phenylobacterium sp.]HVI32561.1 hypothetical protein [Phenylobacterium sp.]